MKGSSNDRKKVLIINQLKMKELKIILLVVALGFGNTVPATGKFTNTFYPNTVKGGLQSSQKQESHQLAVLVVEGNYEYYMQYIKFQLNFKKSDNNESFEKSRRSPACVLAETTSVSC